MALQVAELAIWPYTGRFYEFYEALRGLRRRGLFSFYIYTPAPPHAALFMAPSLFMCTLQSDRE